MAAPAVANSSSTSLSFRSRLDQLADEHERVQARAARLTAENLRLRSLLGRQGDCERPGSAYQESPRHESPSKDACRKDPERVCPNDIALDLAMPADPCGEVLAETTPVANSCALNPSDHPHSQKPCIAVPDPDVRSEDPDEDVQLDCGRQASKLCLQAVEDSPTNGLRYGGTEDSMESCLVGDVGDIASRSSQCSSQESKAMQHGRAGSGNSKRENIFPYWFDPQLSDDDSGEVASSLISWTREHLPSSPKDCGTLSPQSSFSLSRDAMAFIFLMFELWFTPFNLVFLDGNENIPRMRELEYISKGITCFFALDIILNFFTGYVDGDKTVMQRNLIIKNYLKFWFWVDLIATLPYEEFIQSDNEMGKMGRQIKGLKIFKVLRLLKFLRLVRLMKIVENMGMVARHAHLLGPTRKLLKFMEVQIFLILFSHVHGCAWAWLQPREYVEVSSMTAALSRYARSVWWAYSSVTVGSLGVNPRSDRPAIWVLEMIIASERLILIWLAVKRVFFESLKLKNDAEYAAEQRDILALLRQHNVSFATQLKVLWSQDDIRNANLQQSHFQQLLSANLSEDLRREVYHEMWYGRLMSFGLIAHVASWNKRFVDELEKLVSEAVFPSQKVVFQEGDAATAAYCIIHGMLNVTGSMSTKKIAIASFTAGMWVGENSLVSTVMRRSATMESKGITILMVLQGDDFQALISRFGLMQRYQQFCSDQLWRGVCGCCGSIGSHFSDSCDKIFGQQPEVTVSWHAKRRQSFSCNRDLKQFLEAQGLLWLTGTLALMGILSLDDLKTLSMEQLKDALPANHSLSTWDEEALSPSNIQDYTFSRSAKTRQSLFHDVSRLQHLMFLSHYKVEAGTEAALMHTEMQQAIAEDQGSLGHNFDEPVFLDSENLNNLQELQERVSNTHNLVLLLTKGVLSRPWVLVEIVTARREGLQIILVNVSKAGVEFAFPDDEFYAKLRNGEYLGQEATEVLKQCGCSLQDTEVAIREIFHQIAVPYSPHKSMTIRQAEIRAVLKQCNLKTDAGGFESIQYISERSSPRLRRHSRVAPRRSCALTASGSMESLPKDKRNAYESFAMRSFTLNNSHENFMLKP